MLCATFQSTNQPVNQLTRKNYIKSYSFHTLFPQNPKIPLETNPIIIEACVASVESALEAANGGADRLELNCALELDGLTPSPGLYNEIQATVSLPVIVMIRPRSFGFVYSDAEFRAIQDDIDLLLGLGADGIAIGILNTDLTVDTHRMLEICEQVGDSELVFHRAFDVTPNTGIALEQLIDCGVNRVLTSGQAPTAPAGVAQIAKLVEQAKGRIEILPGSGINARNAAVLVHQTGCTQIHGTFRNTGIPSPTASGLDRLRIPPPPGTDAEVVSAVRQAVS